MTPDQQERSDRNRKGECHRSSKFIIYDTRLFSDAQIKRQASLAHSELSKNSSSIFESDDVVQNSFNSDENIQDFENSFAGLFQGPNQDADIDEETLPIEGEIQIYLTQVKAQVISQMNNYGSPECYRQGSFRIVPKDPFFAMQKLTGSTIKPQSLYHPEVFIWLPHLLCPMENWCCPNPKCGKKGTFILKG